MWYEIFKFELQYRKGRVDSYFFFVGLLLFSLVAFDFITQGVDLGPSIHNAPYLIARTMVATTGLFMTVSSIIMGVPILRDFEYKIESLVFVNPIKKWEYLVGRFLGAFVVLFLVFTALPIGLILGEFMPWRDADKLAPFNAWYYLKPYITIVIPSLFISACIFFISGAFTKNLIVVYTQGLFLFVLFVLSYNIENSTLAALVDPFCYQAVGEVIEDWNVAKKNVTTLPMSGIILANRVLWITLALVISYVGYLKFSFNVLRNHGSKKLKNKTPQTPAKKFRELAFPSAQFREGFRFRIQQLMEHSLFYFRSIVSQVSFLAITISAVLIIAINSISLGTTYGVDSYPTTFFIVEELTETSTFFFLIILVFYSGELIWKERQLNVDLIVDSMPVSNFTLLAGKFVGLNLVYLLLLTALTIAGIIFQLSSGYFVFDLKVYFMEFYVKFFTFLSLYTFVSFFIHVVVNSKYVGFILTFLAFASTLAMNLFGVGNILTQFGSAYLPTYSSMNGYGHFLKSYFTVNLYWFAFSGLLLLGTATLLVRGRTSELRKRIRSSRINWNAGVKQLAIAPFVLFLLSGGYIFYNNNVVQKDYNTAEQNEYRAGYEKSLKHLEYLPQPKIVDVNLKVELYPEELQYTAQGTFTFVNKENAEIREIHVQKRISDQYEMEYLDFDQGVEKDAKFADYYYTIYHLRTPLLPGDSLRMNFKQLFKGRSFLTDGGEIDLVYNGSFISNDHFPALGYNDNYELEDQEVRQQYGLSPKKGRAEQDDKIELTYGNSGGDGSKIECEIVVGTNSDQTAIAPGALIGSWEMDGRNYFHYKMENPMVNFYSIVSAKYEKISRPSSLLAENDEPVQLEIYYDKAHHHNVDRMLKGMEKSLRYCSDNFGSYPYKQLRIMEFPMYRSFAQSFPSVIPFSEDLGFILKVDDNVDVDVPFFISAHEAAHQWWGLQLVAANVKGRHMILEALSQYSAIMTLKHNFPQAKIDQFLEQELEIYFDERKSAAKIEVPLVVVDDEDYIHYHKGLLNFYALQEYISEDSLNLALSRFVQTWNAMNEDFSEARFATSIDLISHIRAVTPDSLQSKISELFEKVIFYDNVNLEATASNTATNSHTTQVQVSLEKILSDSAGEEKQISIDDWIEVGLYALNQAGQDSTLAIESLYFQNEKGVLNFETSEKPHKVVFDPNHKLLNKSYKTSTILLND